MKTIHSQSGFTITELLVGMSLFSVVSLGMATFMQQTLQKTALETRAAQAAQELENATTLITNEMQMSAVVSPYLPGTNPENVNCSTATSVSGGDTLRFMVAHDDKTASNGIRSYYVAYVYDSDNGELLRGEVTKADTTNCAVPAQDPAHSDVLQTVAKNIVQIDTNGDGTDESVFALANGTLTVNLGMEVSGPNDTSVTQQISTQVVARKR